MASHENGDFECDHRDTFPLCVTNGCIFVYLTWLWVGLSDKGGLGLKNSVKSKSIKLIVEGMNIKFSI
jgi:hypothetical protein